MAKATFTLSELTSNTTWDYILKQMENPDETKRFPNGYESLPDGSFPAFTITATYADPTTHDTVSSQPLTIYLHKCSFVPEEHHVEHTGSTPAAYNAAFDTALTDSANDTKIHFVPEYTPE
jgi:hypothetical protein